MNDELAELYSSKWDILLAEARKLSVNAANPLLIKVDQKYVESDVKVMVVGQETDGWHERLNDSGLSVERLMERYPRYFNKVSENGKIKNKRPFWNRKNYSDGTATDETLNLIAEVKLPQFDDVKAIRIEHPGRRTLSNVISLQVLKNLLEKEK